MLNALQVGSGKSSLLEALLGEILPIQAGDSTTANQSNSPILRGRVAYSSQIPWIVSACKDAPFHACTSMNLPAHCREHEKDFPVIINKYQLNSA